MIVVAAFLLVSVGCASKVDLRTLPIGYGTGTRLIRLWDPVSKVSQMYGPPDRVRRLGKATVLDYRKRLGLDFFSHGTHGHIREIRFNVGYRGRLPNGIGLGSEMSKVIKLSGGALKRVRRDRKNVFSAGTNRVLYDVTRKGKPLNYLFPDACRGVLYWFNRARRLVQLVVTRPNFSCECSSVLPDTHPREVDGHSVAQRAAMRRLPIAPGRGNERIKLGDSIEKVLRVYGPPEIRRNTKRSIWVTYWNRHRIDFLLLGQPPVVREIRFDGGYEGKLPNGIGLCSRLDEVLAKSGGALRTVRVRRDQTQKHGFNRVLLEVEHKRRRPMTYLFRDARRGVLYWFDRNKRAIQVVVGRARPGVTNPSPRTPPPRK